MWNSYRFFRYLHKVATKAFLRKFHVRFVSIHILNVPLHISLRNLLPRYLRFSAHRFLDRSPLPIRFHSVTLSCMSGSPGDVEKPHSPALSSLHLRHSSFSDTSVISPTSQLILQPFRCFTHATGTSPTSPGEPSVLSSVYNAEVNNEYSNIYRNQGWDSWFDDEIFTICRSPLFHDNDKYHMRNRSSILTILEILTNKIILS